MGTLADSNSSLTQTYDLVSRAKDGESIALERLIARYYERVRRIVRRRLSPNLRDYMDSTDMVQETFVHAVKALDRFEMRNNASVINWLATIAEHTIKGAVDRVDADKRKPPGKVSLKNDSNSQELQVPDKGPSPSEHFARREETDLLRQCLAALPDTYREVLVQRSYHRRSWKEIAELTGRPTEDAARMMYVRALKELRKGLRNRLRE